MCHFFAHLSRERFGKFPDTDSGICRVIALPASAGDRKRSISGLLRSWLPGQDMPESAPCP